MALHSVKDLKIEFEEEIAYVKENCAEEILQMKEKQESENSDINEIGLKVLGINMTSNQFKKRANFPSGIGGEAEYKASVIGTVMEKMLVRCREDFSGTSDYSTIRIKVGDIGRIQRDHKGPEFRTWSGSGPKCQKWSGIGPELGTRSGFGFGIPL